jgi:hypothetical protein
MHESLWLGSVLFLISEETVSTERFKSSAEHDARSEIGVALQRYVGLPERSRDAARYSEA